MPDYVTYGGLCDVCGHVTYAGSPTYGDHLTNGRYGTYSYMGHMINMDRLCQN